MFSVKVRNINELVVKALQEVFFGGYVTDSRNGKVYALYNAFFKLLSPRSRHLNLKGRKNNIFAMIAETIWVISGSDELDPFLSFFLPRAHDFSDDNKTWRGAYGPRLYLHDQLQGVIDVFKKDGLHTRRAVISIYFPNLDSPQSLKKVYNLDATRDVPCNNLIHFYITPDKKFNMNVFQRSGDVIWGMGSINVFEWTFLQELVFENVKTLFPNDKIILGSYNHFVTNLHLYEFTSDQGRAVMKNINKHDVKSKNKMPLLLPKGIETTRNFFKDLIKIYSEEK